MNSLVLHPAKMKNSLFGNEFFKTDHGRIALPYNPKGQRYVDAPSRNPIFSTGLLWTDSIDLAKFAIAITKSLKKSTDLVSKDLVWKLIIPSSSATHGLGFFIGDKLGNEQADGKYIFHAGANIGYLTLLIISKDGKNGAVVLINVSPKWDAKEYPQFEFIKSTVRLIGDYYHW